MTPRPPRCAFCSKPATGFVAAISTCGDVHLEPHDIRRYWRGCRCAECHRAAALYAKRRRRGQTSRLVPVAAVRAHLRRISAHSGLDTIARLSGVSRQELKDIRVGLRRHVRSTTAAKILATLPELKPGGAHVSNWRSKKLLAAMLAEGWTVEDLAAKLQRPARALTRPWPAKVRVSTARQIEQLYQKLMGDAWTEV